MKRDVLTSFWGSEPRGKFSAASCVVQMAFCRDWDNRPHFAVCPPVQGRKTFQKCPCAPKNSRQNGVCTQTRLATLGCQFSFQTPVLQITGRKLNRRRHLTQLLVCLPRQFELFFILFS